MKHKVPLVKLIAVKLQHHTEIMRPTAIFHLKNIARAAKYGNRESPSVNNHRLKTQVRF